jgi:hypothetical protein
LPVNPLLPVDGSEGIWVAVLRLDQAISRAVQAFKSAPHAVLPE